MENYIKKNILIDELLEYNLTYYDDLLYTFHELRNSSNFDTDIILFNNCIEYINYMIDDSQKYINNNVNNEYEYITEINLLNNLYEARNKIINYLNSLKETDILADLISEINIK
jgi:hypothetical protein